MGRLMTMLVLCATIIGCSTSPGTTPYVPPIVTIQETKVPVPVCPVQIVEMDVPDRPKLAIEQLTVADVDNYDKVAKAYMRTVAALLTYSKQLESTINGTKDSCRAINNNVSSKLTK